METFAPVRAPSVDGTSRTSEARERAVQFGDGYEQRTPDGLNAVRRRARWSWLALEADEADDIETFLLDNATAGFLYTFPGDVERKWKVVNGVTRTPQSAHERLEVEVREVFDP